MQIKKLIQMPTGQYTIMEMARWLWHAMRGNRLQACLNATIGLLGVVLSLLVVWAMQRAIDIASGTLPGSIYWAVALMAVLFLGEFALGISRIWIRNILGVKARNRMQQQLMGHLLRSQWQGREAMHSGDIVNRLEEDVRQVVSFLTETLPSVLSTLAMFIGAFVYLLQMDVWLACITVFILPLFALLSRYYIAHMRRLSRKVRRTDSAIQSLLTETLQHRTLVKTMEADGQMLNRLDRRQWILRQWVRRRAAFSVVSSLLLNLGFSLGYLLAFLWGALRMHAGTLTFGGMTAFLQLVYRIQEPARDITRLAPAFVQVFTSTERLMELERLPEEEQGEPHPIAAPCGIRFDDVSFSYPGGQQPIVEHRSFCFEPATCSAIVGQTGAGKTTLIRLLLALIKPQQGHIYIFSGEKGDAASADSIVGQELSPLHRCNFVYVPQGNTLLSGTLRDNLLLGNPDATDEQMAEALRMACADFVADLPSGLSSFVSEQGGGLSEGQAQRISIARALLRPGSIMLLDEATSALDADTERQVLNNLLGSCHRTVIFITHREAVVDYCQQVIRV